MTMTTTRTKQRIRPDAASVLDAWHEAADRGGQIVWEDKEFLARVAAKTLRRDTKKTIRAYRAVLRDLLPILKLAEKSLADTWLWRTISIDRASMFRQHADMCQEARTSLERLLGEVDNDAVGGRGSDGGVPGPAVGVDPGWSVRR